MNPFRKYKDDLMRLCDQLELVAQEYKFRKSRVRTLKEVYNISVAKNEPENIITSQKLLQAGEKNLKDQKRIFDELKKQITNSILSHFKSISKGKIGFSTNELSRYPDIVRARDKYVDLMTEVYNIINKFDADNSSIETFHDDIQRKFQKVFLHIVQVLMPLNVEELRKSA